MYLMALKKSFTPILVTWPLISENSSHHCSLNEFKMRKSKHSCVEALPGKKTFLMPAQHSLQGRNAAPGGVCLDINSPVCSLSQAGGDIHHQRFCFLLLSVIGLLNSNEWCDFWRCIDQGWGRYDVTLAECSSNEHDQVMTHQGSYSTTFWSCRPHWLPSISSSHMLQIDCHFIQYLLLSVPVYLNLFVFRYLSLSLSILSDLANTPKQTLLTIFTLQSLQCLSVSISAMLG